MNFLKKKSCYSFIFQMISPFQLTPPETPIPSPLTPLTLRLIRSHLHPFTHSHLNTLASPYSGASSIPPFPLRSDEAILCFICIWSPGSLHVYSWFSPWELWVVQGVDIVLLMGFQPPSAHSVLHLTLPLVFAGSV